jgi:hypothetical protein
LVLCSYWGLDYYVKKFKMLQNQRTFVLRYKANFGKVDVEVECLYDAKDIEDSLTKKT